MSQKPIKRSPQLVKLSRDHHFGLLLAWKIRQGIRFEVAAPRITVFVLETFRKEVEPHFQQEENCIFSLLPPDDALRLQAEKEHVWLRTQSVELEHDMSYERLSAFADFLDAHIRFEERQLFNYIEEKSSQEQLRQAERCIAAMPQPQLENWADEFWVKK